MVASADDLVDTSADAMRALGAAVSACGSLASVNLSTCRLTAGGVLALVEGVAWAEAGLAQLDLGGNEPLDGPAGEALAKALAAAPPSLQTLVLGPKSTRLALRECEGASLNLSGQGLGPGEVMVVAWYVSTAACAKVTALDLGGNAVTDKGEDSGGLVALGWALAGARLTSLGLNTCGLTAGDVQNLVESVAWAEVGLAQLDQIGRA